MSNISGIYLAAVACVVGISTGQVIFKAAAIAINDTGSYLSPKALLWLILALSWYCLTSIAWVYVLQKIDLGKVYPLMALAFILVPVASKVFFGESFGSQYLLGVLLIMAGIYLCVKI